MTSRMVEFWLEWVIREGIAQKHERYETKVEHWMKQLRMSIIFPNKRLCRRATLSHRSIGKTTLLAQKHFALLPDGRQKLTWEIRRPRFHDCYTIKWVW